MGRNNPRKHSTPKIQKKANKLINKPSAEHGVILSPDIYTAFYDPPVLPENLNDLMKEFPNIVIDISNRSYKKFSEIVEAFRVKCGHTELVKDLDDLVHYLYRASNSIEFICNSVQRTFEEKCKNKKPENVSQIEKHDCNSDLSITKLFSNDTQGIIEPNSNFITNESTLQDSFSQTDFPVENIKETSELSSYTNIEPIISKELSQILNLSSSNDLSHTKDSTTSSKNNSKQSKVMIYNLPPNVFISDILEAITNIIHRPVTSFTLLQTFKRKTSVNSNVLCQIDCDIANLLLNSKVIEIKSNNYTISKFIRVNRCFRCQELGHLAKSCRNVLTCAICSQNHNSNNCQNKPKCINCYNHNRTFHLSIDTNHTAFSHDCTFYRSYIYKRRNNLSLSLINHSHSQFVPQNRSLPLYFNSYNSFY